ncbi:MULTISPECIES: phasin family protein [Methylosinus]|uniref:Phasin domain-containing protein n=1 Tax=Methylosinus trichosporium (strain ATCC 35070 / NCIMB 11131 / UNIQEM 75 / OB3b) TaxID=595536 RepID=A0A2D2CXV7_METT3|nr:MULTISPECIES: phasin family protein [Methylosinus]ATQ67565.1 hypothetical protein CQW49_06445 [Methylosinus trichosporium OB3b]OBS50802.1 hypothetical protein A8B73_19770 [Methylosinus sp. 3S-1]
MATHFKGPAKPRAPKVAPISLKDELDADEPVAPPADTPFAAPSDTTFADTIVSALEAEPVASEAVAPAEILEPATAANIIIEPLAAVEPEPSPAAAEPLVIVAAVTSAAPATLDASALPLKTLDLFNENAAAMMDFALALGAAKTVGDALELQSRFASERYSSLVRQAGEVAELTRRLAFQHAPFKLRVSTFVA